MSAECSGPPTSTPSRRLVGWTGRRELESSRQRKRLHSQSGPGYIKDDLPPQETSATHLPGQNCHRCSRLHPHRLAVKVKVKVKVNVNVNVNVPVPVHGEVHVHVIRVPVWMRGDSRGLSASRL